MFNSKKIAAILIVLTVAACARASEVMPSGDGTYFISAHASVIRGGGTKADSIAYQRAQRFCALKDPKTHAIVVDTRDHGAFIWEGVNFHFKCGV